MAGKFIAPFGNASRIAVRDFNSSFSVRFNHSSGYISFAFQRPIKEGKVLRFDGFNKVLEELQLSTFLNFHFIIRRSLLRRSRCNETLTTHQVRHERLSINDTNYN